MDGGLKTAADQGVPGPDRARRARYIDHNQTGAVSGQLSRLARQERFCSLIGKWNANDDVSRWFAVTSNGSYLAKSGAVFFPRVVMQDNLSGNRLVENQHAQISKFLFSLPIQKTNVANPFQHLI